MNTLTVILLLSFLFWAISHDDYKILDIFSSVKKGYGILEKKEYITPRLKIITERVRRSHGEDFGTTISDVPTEIQVPEKCILHISLTGKTITAPVTSELYDSVNQGDIAVLCRVRYSRPRQNPC